jgi:hypothetical protein
VPTELQNLGVAQARAQRTTITTQRTEFTEKIRHEGSKGTKNLWLKCVSKEAFVIFVSSW